MRQPADRTAVPIGSKAKTGFGGGYSTRRSILDGGSGVLKQKRAWNRGQRQRRYDDDGAGNADGVAEEPCSGRREGGRPDRDRVEHAEQMCAPFRRGILWHRSEERR